MPKEAKAEAAEKKRTRGTRREMREGTRRGLKRHADAPKQGDEGAPTTRTTRSWDWDEAAGLLRQGCG